METNHTAWRFINNNTLYVSGFDWSQNRKGDPYEYNSDSKKALQMTEFQCRKFCRYMQDCATVGFWS